MTRPPAADPAASPRPGRTASLHRADATAVGVAVAAWVGAAGPWRPGAPLVAFVVLGAVAARHRIVALVAVAAVVGLLAGRAEAGVEPVAPGPFAGEVTLVRDPEDRTGQVRAEVRAGARRLELVASGGPAGSLRRAAAGDRLMVVGRTGSARGAPGYLRSRHLAGRLEATAVEPGGDPALLHAAANAFRHRVATGAEVLPEASAALVAGLVFGDDRELPPASEHDLRAAGLAHLTAVSGQNVAFLLVVAAPLLRRLELTGRLLVVAGMLGAFVVVTRAEPSVVRACAMALLATAGTTFGRPISGPRLLAWAVAGLVVVDPLLVDSLGFRLSVAATAGILLGAVPLADALPGPRWLAAPVAVTASAQAGVSPLLVASGLPVPVVALVANPIAGPAAGWTMGWGVTVGWVAGFLPPGPAGILHLPTRATTAVVLGTARWAAEAPVGSLGPGHLAVAGVGGALVAATWFRWRRDRPPGAVPPMPRWARLGRLVGSAAVVGALVAAAVPGGPAPGERALATGAQVVADDGAVAVVLDGRADALAVLDALRAEGVRRIDHLVVRSPGPRVAATARVVASRLASGEVVVPTGAVTPGRAVRRPERLVVGARVLELTPTASGLDVGVGSLR